jgi:flagellin-like protein
MLTKKGVSPLIATVLLLVFALTLGGIVMNFTQTSTIELRDKASDKMERGLTCSLDLDLEILEIGSREYICYNRTGSDGFGLNNLEVIVQNSGSANAEGIRVFILDYNERPTTVDDLTPLGAHNRTKYNLNITKTDDTSNFEFPPSKIIISPIIKHTRESVDICSDNRIEIEEIYDCDEI